MSVSSQSCSDVEEFVAYSETGISFLGQTSDDVSVIGVFIFLTMGLIAVGKQMFFSHKDSFRKGIIKSVVFLFLVGVSVSYQLFMPDINEYNEALYSDLMENPSDFTGGISAATESLKQNIPSGDFDLTNLGK